MTEITYTHTHTHTQLKSRNVICKTETWKRATESDGMQKFARDVCWQLRVYEDCTVLSSRLNRAALVFSSRGRVRTAASLWQPFTRRRIRHGGTQGHAWVDVANDKRWDVSSPCPGYHSTQHLLLTSDSHSFSTWAVRPVCVWVC